MKAEALELSLFEVSCVRALMDGVLDSSTIVMLFDRAVRLQNHCRSYEVVWSQRYEQFDC